MKKANENTNVLRRLVKHHREGLFKSIAPYGSRPGCKEEEVSSVKKLTDTNHCSALLKEAGADVALEANEKIATPVGRLPAVSMVAMIETAVRDETPEFKNGKVVVPENGKVVMPEKGETVTAENAAMPSSEEPSDTESRNNPHTPHSISYYLNALLLLLCFVFIMIGIMGVKAGGGIEWVRSVTRQEVLWLSHDECSYKTRMKNSLLPSFPSFTLSFLAHELSPWMRKEEWLLFLYYALRGLCQVWNIGIGDVYRFLHRRHDGGGTSSPPIDE